MNINISVTTAGDFISGSKPSSYLLREDTNLDDLYIATTDDSLNEENGMITVRILEGDQTIGLRLLLLALLA